MKSKCFFLFLLSLFGLASCSPVPKPIPHEFTHQTKMEAAQHWGVLARDFATQIAASIQEKPLPLTNSEGSEFGYMNGPDSGRTFVELPYIYLQTNDVSDFGKTFRSYVITELSRLGYPIAHTSPEGALIARWSVSKINHDANRIASGFPATWTASSLIGYGVYKILDHTSSAYAGVLAAGVALDVINSSGDYLFPNNVPHTEIVLTFTVSKYEQIFSRQTQAYYVNAEDFDHYANIADYAGQERSLTPVKFNVTNK
ncbi:MAG: hypothetical protein U9R57_08965 [Thermodesulfobacteriota bacterium]|nr:hypothetical protein [Thermodesulfobacteriota bacterium]